MDRDALLALEEQAAGLVRGAGQLSLAYFERVKSLDVSEKGPQDFVSEADRDVEMRLLKGLEEALPGSVFLAEETASAYKPTERPLWIVDPIDGTGNFVRGIPLFCTSVALLVDGKVRLGLVYDPIRDELFSAALGEGAKLDGEPVFSTKTPALSRAVVGVGRSHRAEDAQTFEGIRRLCDEGASVRLIGSGALAATWVAAGRLDAFWELHLNAWDIAAAILLAEEAGARVNVQISPEVLREGAPFLVAAPLVFDAVRVVVRM